MPTPGKKFAAARAQVEERPYVLDEAIPLVQKLKYTKFDETVEVAMRLGVDPKHADQMVRGTVVLPHGLGKTKRVLVIGKVSFPAANLLANAHALVDSVMKAKPPAAKGKYLKSLTVSSTMGPGVAIDTAHVESLTK